MRWAFLRLPYQRREPDNFLLPPASSPILLCLKGRAFASTLIATPATGFALLRLVGHQADRPCADPGCGGDENCARRLRPRGWRGFSPICRSCASSPRTAPLSADSQISYLNLAQTAEDGMSRVHFSDPATIAVLMAPSLHCCRLPEGQKAAARNPFEGGGCSLGAAKFFA